MQLYGNSGSKKDEISRKQSAMMTAGLKLFKEKSSPAGREALERMINSGNPQTIKAAFAIIFKYVKDPDVIKTALGYFSDILEFQRGEGVEPSKAEQEVLELLKQKVSYG